MSRTASCRTRTNSPWRGPVEVVPAAEGRNPTGWPNPRDLDFPLCLTTSLPIDETIFVPISASGGLRRNRHRRRPWQRIQSKRFGREPAFDAAAAAAQHPAPTNTFQITNPMVRHYRGS
uniref:(northern house mosquito) hypothetical protein n=1 Tax=Culex pipiens TaxID=7175 RepID=A0A8D8IJS8_CULPI